MPVSYFDQASRPGHFYMFKLLLTFWKGSAVKLIGAEILIFLILYYILALIYMYGLNENYQGVFEKIVKEVYTNLNMIKVSFMLNIFISLVYERYVVYYLIMPWNLRCSHLIGAHWRNYDPFERLLRRTVGRYFSAAFALSLSKISLPIYRMFPTKDDIVRNGLLQRSEAAEIENISTVHAQPFVPISWGASIVSKANQDGMIKSINGYISIVKEISSYQSRLVTLFIMNRITYSLVYFQVVSISVITYSLACVVARQNVASSVGSRKETIKNFYPLFPPLVTVCELMIFLGLNKLSLSLQNPLGNDDSDFDTAMVYDANKELSLSYQDAKEFTYPIPLRKDQFFNSTTIVLHQTKISKCLMRRCGDYIGSQWNSRQQELGKKPCFCKSCSKNQ